jgi:ion channel
VITAGLPRPARARRRGVHDEAANFGGRLTHTDGLYFTVTVFSTVGFGYITAHTQAARPVVTGHMITDLVILGLAVKIIAAGAKGCSTRTSATSRQPRHTGCSRPS